MNPKKPKKAGQAKKNKGGDGPRVAAILDQLDLLYPEADCELTFNGSYQLLVAVILSAQCTDKRVNLVTPALFRRYPDATAMAAASQEELEGLIRTTGFFRMKAKHIREACQKIVKEHGGEVPRTMEALLRLPGVARKTANVVLGTAFRIPSGVVVDTHIRRLSLRLGMTKMTDPEKIERDLMERWPEDRWIKTGHQLIWHGRRVCDARRPRCESCTLAPLCPSAELSAGQSAGRGQ
jgi:endonuclease-3